MPHSDTIPDLDPPAENVPYHIGLITGHPSPHMIDFLNAMAANTDLRLSTVFLQKRSTWRSWGVYEPCGAFEYIPRNLLALCSWIRQNVNTRRYDALVVSLTYWEPLAWFLRRAALRAGLPLFFYNEPPNLEHPWPIRTLKSLVLRAFLRSFNGVWATGTSAVAVYDEMVHSTLPVRNLGYYVDLTPFLGINHVGLSEPRATGVRLVYCGQLIRRKSVHTLLLACCGIPDPWQLDIYGSGPLLESLRRRVPSSAAGRVVFHGEVPFRDRGKIFQQADILVLPSTFDGWGMVVVEALAAGVPVVASDAVVAGQNFIRAGENGFLFKPTDVDSLRQAILAVKESILSSPNYRERVRNSIRRHTPQTGATQVVRYLGEDMPRTEVNNGDTLSLGLASPYRERPGQTLRRVARSVAIAVASPLSRQAAPPLGLTILVYHFVNGQNRTQFEKQIRYLSSFFEVVSLLDGLHRLERGDRTPALAVTFDDAFEQSTRLSSEILIDLGVKATYFIPTIMLGGMAKVSESRVQRGRFSLRSSLKPATLGTLVRAGDMGHDLQIHGHEHLSLMRLPFQEAVADVAHAVHTFESVFQRRPCALAYPFGEMPSHPGFSDSLLAHGLVAACTVRRGANSDISQRYALARQHVEGHWPLAHIRYFVLQHGGRLAGWQS
jgi:glycosyltransferase involved in cell wall biosynthesis/peptidoglycan/xylan/chitin deacetylase (PgdA/CDA1 family)